MIPAPPEFTAAMAQLPSLTVAAFLTLLALATGALCLIYRIHRLPLTADLAILSAARKMEPARRRTAEAPAVWIPHQLRDDSYRDDTGTEAQS